jgi:glucose-6-phosphate 1-dehydrogenase
VRQIAPADMPDNVVVGQYAGYRQIEEVAPDSRTPTYAAIRLYLDNWRWQGVPFYLRSGKALKGKTTEITIQFKEPPHNMFAMAAGERIRPNVLSICVQPDEGIHLRFEAKVPDTLAEMRSVDMDFHYAEGFGQIAIPEAYERLLMNALNGDASLFTRADGIEEAWRIIDPILQYCEVGGAFTAEYAKGSWGPPAADEFLAREGRHWRLGCAHE